MAGDPFSIRPVPLRYRREGENYLIYSVGRDGLDQKGKSAKIMRVNARAIGALPGDYFLVTPRSILDE